MGNHFALRALDFCNAMASMNFWWWWWAGQDVVLISVVALCRTKIDFLSSAVCSG